jgi:hypothetical protein
VASEAEFADLLAEAEAASTAGWDLSRFGDRRTSTEPPWSYWSLVGPLAGRAHVLVDMGTGGGEQLALSGVRAAGLTVATESWPPNVPVAARRLGELGIPVVRTEMAPDNQRQTADDTRGRLPFLSGSLPLVINRHEAFNAREVARVLSAGGVFLTQQVGDDYSDLDDLLGRPPRPGPPAWTLAAASAQLVAAGLRVEAGEETSVSQTFSDVGVFGWYLRQVPWAVPGFSLDREADRAGLLAVHGRIRTKGPVRVRQAQFWVRAAKVA